MKTNLQGPGNPAMARKVPALGKKKTKTKLQQKTERPNAQMSHCKITKQC